MSDEKDGVSPDDRDQVLKNAEAILNSFGISEHASTLYQSYMPLLVALGQIKNALRQVIGFTEETTEIMCLTIWSKWFSGNQEGYYEDDSD